jgi:hypothetical protein
MSASQFSGTPAGLTPLRTGEASIPATLFTVNVADTAITSTSIVLATGGGAGAALGVYGVGALSPGVGFTLNSSIVAPVGGIDVRWMVLRY